MKAQNYPKKLLLVAILLLLINIDSFAQLGMDYDGPPQFRYSRLRRFAGN